MRAGRKFENGITDSVKVRDLLSELRVLYGADRVGLWQFSNGDYYVSGTSIMKSSMTHFVTKTGIASPPPSQNLPTTHMVMSLKSLQASDFCCFDNTSLTDDAFQESLFATTGSQFVLSAAVREPNKNWIGILVIAWLDKPAGTVSGQQLVSYARQVGEFMAKQR